MDQTPSRQQVEEWARQLGIIANSSGTEKTNSLALTDLSKEECFDISKSHSIQGIKAGSKIALLDICYQYFLELGR